MYLNYPYSIFFYVIFCYFWKIRGYLKKSFEIKKKKKKNPSYRQTSKKVYVITGVIGYKFYTLLLLMTVSKLYAV